MSKIAISSTYPSSEFEQLYEDLQPQLQEEKVLLSYQPIKTARVLPELALVVAGIVGKKLLEKMIDYLYDKFVKPKEDKGNISYYIVHIDSNMSFKLPEEREKCLEHFALSKVDNTALNALFDTSEWKMAELSLTSSGDTQRSLIVGLLELFNKKNLNSLKSLLWIVNNKLANPDLPVKVVHANDYSELLEVCKEDYINLFFLYTYSAFFEQERLGLRFVREAKEFIKLFRQIPSDRVLREPDPIHAELLKPFLSASVVYLASKWKDSQVVDDETVNDFFYKTLNHVAIYTKVIHGDNANANLEFGTGIRYRYDNMRDIFNNVILHELGHHQFQYTSGIPYA